MLRSRGWVVGPVRAGEVRVDVLLLRQLRLRLQHLLLGKVNEGPHQAILESSDDYARWCSSIRPTRETMPFTTMFLGFPNTFMIITSRMILINIDWLI